MNRASTITSPRAASKRDATSANASRLPVGCERNMAELNAVPVHERSQVGVIGDDQRDIRIEIAAAPLVEQVGHAVILLAGQDHHPAAHARIAQLPVEFEQVGHVVEPPGEFLWAEGQALGQDLDPLEETPRPQVGVLSRLDHRAAMLGDEPGHRGHDAGAVRAGDGEDEATVATGACGRGAHGASCARIRRRPGSYSGAADSRTARSPCGVQTSNRPESSHSCVTPSSWATMARPTAPPNVCP